MARYRLVLLEGPGATSAALEDVARSLPASIDRAAFDGAIRGTLRAPVRLAGGDDLSALEAASARLQDAGLVVCVIDDSTPWIRLVETVRTSLGFTKVTVVAESAAQSASTLAHRTDDAGGPSLKVGMDPRWRRLGIAASVIVLPIGGALMLMTFASEPREHVGTVDTPLLATTSSPVRAAGPGRHLRMHVGAGSGDATEPAERTTGILGGRGAQSLGRGGGGPGDTLELVQDAESATPATPAGPAPGPSRERTTRKAIAAVVGVLLGLLAAAVLGELAERSTRTRSAAIRRRLRSGVHAVAALAVVAAPVVGWSLGHLPPTLSPETSAAAAPSSAVRADARRPAAHVDARCAGGAFARFLCRSRPAAAPTRPEPRPFATLLAGFRRRAHDHPDAGPAVVPAAAPDAAVVAAVEAATRGHHHHHRHDAPPATATASAAEPPATSAPSAPPATAAAPPPAVAVAPAVPSAVTDASTAPAAAPESVVVEAPSPGAAPADEAPSALETVPARAGPPRQRPLPPGWTALWFFAGLAVGLVGTPGWRRLGRS